jgi:aerobic carbon-monoxide dehydrogenase medium subunit
MIPPAFDYMVPGGLSEALQILRDRPEARPLAGGQSLIPQMKQRLISPAALVDIGRLTELRGIAIHEGSAVIGPMTTSRTLEESEDLARALPMMREAAMLVADPAVRNRGTLGGSLAYADPTGDWPAVALALDARLTATGTGGSRTILASEFFLGGGRTALRRGELLTSIALRRPPPGSGEAYVKLRHPASGYALVGVAAVLSLGESGRCDRCAVAVTGAGPRVHRAFVTERMLEGEQVSRDRIAAAAGHASDHFAFDSDIYASAPYRAHLVRVHVRRALEVAFGRVVL